MHKGSIFECVAVDFVSGKLVHIRPRPNIPLKSFKVCKFFPRCGKKQCTYAHSDIELKAWNYDLKKGRRSNYIKLM